MGVTLFAVALLGTAAFAFEDDFPLQYPSFAKGAKEVREKKLRDLQQSVRSLTEERFAGRRAGGRFEKEASRVAFLAKHPEALHQMDLLQGFLIGGMIMQEFKSNREHLVAAQKLLSKLSAQAVQASLRGAQQLAEGQEVRATMQTEARMNTVAYHADERTQDVVGMHNVSVSSNPERGCDSEVNAAFVTGDAIERRSHHLEGRWVNVVEVCMVLGVLCVFVALRKRSRHQTFRSHHMITAKLTIPSPRSASKERAASKERVASKERRMPSHPSTGRTPSKASNYSDVGPLATAPRIMG